jgi:hypothetical protein
MEQQQRYWVDFLQQECTPFMLSAEQEFSVGMVLENMLERGATESVYTEEGR